MNVDTFTDPVIHSAEKLGALTPAAIFAFMWLWQAIKELRKESAERTLKENENERREQSILSEERQTEAMRSIANNIVMLRDAHNSTTIQMALLNTIVTERIPKREHP